MTNIIKKDNARQGAFGSVVDQLFHRNLNRWLDDDYWGFNGLSTRSGVPVNLRETDKSYELALVAPGLAKEDFQINFSKDTLTISFERKDSSSQNNNNGQEGMRWLMQEYRQESFKRSFVVDDTVDVDKAAARYENGVLYLSLPKKEHAQPIARTIQIQ